MHTPLTSPRIAVFFGGPSSEKDISLDSCRTFVDAVRGGIPDENLQVFFLSETLATYRISIDWLYSNTIGDFWPLFDENTHSRGVLTPMSNLQECLRDTDAICCFVHGVFGEDGGLAQICEQMGRSAYLGSKPAPLDLTFSKSKTHHWYKQHGYTVAKQIAIEASAAIDNIDISALTQNNPAVVVKPARGGSSDGVSIVTARDLPQAIATAREFSSDVVIEELIQGLEFSVVAIQDIDDTVIVFEPTAVIPQVPVGATHDTPFYTRLQKYMPGSGAQHYTPLPVAPELIEKLRAQAQKIFRESELRDWARLDGFIRKGDGACQRRNRLERNQRHSRVTVSMAFYFSRPRSPVSASARFHCCCSNAVSIAKANRSPRKRYTPPQNAISPCSAAVRRRSVRYRA